MEPKANSVSERGIGLAGQLDAEGWSPRDRAGIVGNALTAVLLAISDPVEQRKLVLAHLAALRATFVEVL